ncbi:hypothetical protein P152DRAFT_172326 [Eremomyces bilateralis CBS 781.70]|uniref:Uncharacterized protein n=1 Tax=Eremomyces bilateralis CBS 781.70 TaxID=1392243 RepID=A0A6G1FTX2_9PEZI|nr:uncharacterized protein P152DRAFT_172326 [Eremomyces bilateralis CBS 781.70]KAF1809190.1 hypothetical protein P152DRAFT_172326 [Eremomyces bilateralis CBS 781.70]
MVKLCHPLSALVALEAMAAPLHLKESHKRHSHSEGALLGIRENRVEDTIPTILGLLEMDTINATGPWYPFLNKISSCHHQDGKLYCLLNGRGSLCSEDRKQETTAVSSHSKIQRHPLDQLTKLRDWECGHNEINHYKKRYLEYETARAKLMAEKGYNLQAKGGKVKDLERELGLDWQTQRIRQQMLDPIIRAKKKERVQLKKDRKRERKKWAKWWKKEQRSRAHGNDKRAEPDIPRVSRDDSIPDSPES